MKRENVASCHRYDIECLACYYSDNDVNDADDVPCVHKINECVSCKTLFFQHPYATPATEVKKCICDVQYEWHSGQKRCPVHTILVSDDHQMIKPTCLVASIDPKITRKRHSILSFFSKLLK